MSNNVQNLSGSKFYQVRKEVVWFGLLLFVTLVIYDVYDYMLHVNWPPRTLDSDVSHENQKLIGSVNCKDIGKYWLTKQQYPQIKDNSLDRKMYVLEPQCEAQNYFFFEGSGLRITSYIYDLENQRRTATIVTTFNKF